MSFQSCFIEAASKGGRFSNLFFKVGFKAQFYLRSALSAPQGFGSGVNRKLLLNVA